MTTALRFNILRAIAILIFIAAAMTLIKPILAEDATSTASTKKDKLQEKVEARKAAVSKKVEATKEKVENKIAALKEKAASREALLKLKLAAFKDKRKAQIAERVNTNLNRVNRNQTSQMKKHLEKMSQLLDKLEARVNSSSPDIKDPSATKGAIASARAKIASTTQAVETQADKDYTITITSESKVKTAAQSSRDQLKTDLHSIRKQVIDAKQAVSTAIRVAKGNKAATPSAKEVTNSEQ